MKAVYKTTQIKLPATELKQLKKRAKRANKTLSDFILEKTRSQSRVKSAAPRVGVGKKGGKKEKGTLLNLLRFAGKSEDRDLSSRVDEIVYGA